MGSRAVFQPVGQKRLTNIAIVRLKKSGNRFEIACYQNKVRDWRNGIEKNLDDVLQSTTVFTNVSKGILAKDKDLMEAFGTSDQAAICGEILKKGELQVADKERKMEYDNLFRDVASVLVEKCVNPDTSRPYTITILERALRDVHFNVDPKKAAKQQALEALPLLQAKFPIERARMRLKVTAPSERKAELLEMVDFYDPVVESVEQVGNLTSVVAQIEPGAFRELHNRLQTEMQGKGRVEVLSMTVVAEGLQVDEFSNHRSSAIVMSPQPDAQVFPAADVFVTGSSQAAPAAPVSSRSERVAATSTSRAAAAGSGEVVYPRGEIQGLPEEHASRKERFAELDMLQAGWQVELKTKGESVEAVFYTPSGQKVGAFANARRMALAAHKALAV